MTEFHISQTRVVTNKGAYVESPFHESGEGPDIADLALRQQVVLNSVAAGELAAAWTGMR